MDQSHNVSTITSEFPLTKLVWVVGLVRQVADEALMFESAEYDGATTFVAAQGHCYAPRSRAWVEVDVKEVLPFSAAWEFGRA